MLYRRILKLTPEAFWVFIEKAGVAVAGFVGIKLLTQVLAPSEFGRLALANTIVMLIGNSFFGPFGQGLLRFWSISKERGELHTFYYLFGRISFYAVVVSLVFALIFCCTITLITDFNWAVLIVLSMAIGILTGLLSLIISIFTAARLRKHTALLQVGNKFLRPLCAMLLIICLAVPGADIALTGYLVAVIVMFIIAKGLYNRNILKNYDDSKTDVHTESFKNLGKEIWKYAWPFLVWAGFGWVHLSCDKWSLQAFQGSDVVGAFAVVSSLSTYPLVFGSGFLATLFRPIAFQRAGDLNKAESLSSANKILLLMTGVYILGAMIIIGVFSLFHHSLVVLISNKQFAEYSYLLPWLTFTWFLFYLGQVLANWGLVAKCTHYYIFPKCVSAVIALAATFILANRMGVEGVVLGLGIAGLVYTVWCSILAIIFSFNK